MEQLLLMLEGLFNLELAVFLVATLPFIELRGAIPLALALGLSPGRAFILAILGNLLPVLPILLLFSRVSERLRVFSPFDRFLTWLHARTIKKSDKVERYGPMGLIFFTAVPLPTTGAWTASLAAILFRIKIRYAFPAISLGVLIAGVVVTLLGLLTGITP